MTKIILDTDPGIDDAIAIGAMLFSPELDVRMITSAKGNSSLSNSTRNVLKLLKFWDKKVPVYHGEENFMSYSNVNAEGIHGDTGMDGFDFGEVDDTKVSGDYQEMIYKELTESKEKVTLIGIAPLTDYAKLLTRYPEVKSKIEKIILMCGSTERGNQTPMAEYNAYCDPLAAEIVFSSGIDIVMCGLNITNNVLLTKSQVEKISSMNESGFMISRLLEHYRGGSAATGYKMHDLCAVAYAVHPEFFTTLHCNVTVETTGKYTKGCTVVDLRNKLDKPANADVCIDADASLIIDWLIDRIKLM